MEPRYNPADLEQKWYKFWEEHGYFQADPDSTKPRYSLLMPPPNLTGNPHMGHAMQHAILDTVARFRRMQQYDVLLLPGVDHAGIQFESTFNKQLAKEGLSKHKLGRDEWLKRAWQFKDQVYQTFHQTWSVFGISADWSREVFTLDDVPRQAVFHEFKTFWDEGLIYKGAYIVQWCPKDATAIEDVEMEYEERREQLYYVKYLILKDAVDSSPLTVDSQSNNNRQPSTVNRQHESPPGDEYITIATARPETIYADTGIAVYPNHPDYAKFIGKQAVNPLTGQPIPIFADDRVDKDFGTGALKITPGHDPLDFAIGQDHHLPILHAVDKSGRTTDLTQDLAGLPIKEARQKAAQKLQQLGAIAKVEDYTHSVPVCERCKTTVEPLISEEWFVKMDTLAQKALTHLSEINFLPENYHKILADWLEHIHDWSISRSLWWGHRIPVWYCDHCNPHHQVAADKGLVISLDEPDQDCPVCHSHQWTQDEHVLDTWFSSGLWPMSTLGWPDDIKELNRYFPWDLEVTAPEIKYLWIARMIMLALHFKDQIPFKTMYFHGMLRDLQGRKFSKSLGNGINPLELRDHWGTDAARLTLLSYSVPGRDARVNKQIMDERAKNYRNFATKLWNISRFIIDLRPEEATANHQPSTVNQNPNDQAILAQLNQTITVTTQHLENFDLHLASDELYNFVWHQLADIYLEQTKSRRADAQPTLEYILETTLRLLHPFIPFVTEEIYSNFHKTLRPDQPYQPLIISPWPATTEPSNHK